MIPDIAPPALLPSRTVQCGLTASLGLLLMLLLAGCSVRADPRLKHEQAVINDPAAMLRIAETSATNHDWQSAEAFYRRAETLLPRRADIRIELARSISEQGRFDEAAGVLEAALASFPDDLDLSLTFTRLLLYLGKDALARDVARQGLRYHPDAIDLQQLLGRARGPQHAQASPGSRPSHPLHTEAASAANAMSGDCLTRPHTSPQTPEHQPSGGPPIHLDMQIAVHRWIHIT